MNTERQTAPPEETEFTVALAAAIKLRGVSLAWLRSRLVDRGNPVSLATLSYWRSGRRRPEGPASMQAVEDIEDLLGLPRGALTSLVGPSRRPGPRAPQAAVHEVVDDRAALVQRALDDLGLVGPQQLTDVTASIVVEVDSRRRVRAITTTGVWRAAIAGAQRLPLIYVNEDPVHATPEISVVGGRLGRDCSRPEVGLVAREFVLDRPLALKEEAVLEQRTVFVEDVMETTYEHYLTDRLADFTLSIRFQPDCLPLRAVAHTIADEVEDEWELDVVGRTSAYLILRRFGPGRAGITWEWDARRS